MDDPDHRSARRPGPPPSSMRPEPAAEDSNKFFTIFAGCLVIINACTFVYHFLGSQLFAAIGNSVSLGLIVYSLLFYFSVHLRNNLSAPFLNVAAIGISLSLLYNFSVASFADGLKFLSLFIFFAAGRASGGRMTRVEQVCICVTCLIPLIFLGTKGSSKVYENESFADEVFAYFPNINTGVLYFSAILFALTQLYGNRVIVAQFLNALLMQKIGAVVATAVGLLSWVAFPLRKESIVGLAALTLAVFAAYSFGALDRTLNVLDSLVRVYDMGSTAVTAGSYKKLVLLTGSTDLSAFFRIIHWSDIWSLYSGGGLATILLGYGSGQTAQLTAVALAPHNDYLRVLAEYGLLNFIVFVPFVIFVRSSMQQAAARVLFTVLCIYFLSENLLDNFTSMAIYFAYAGRFATSLAPASAGAARRFHALRGTMQTPGNIPSGVPT